MIARAVAGITMLLATLRALGRLCAEGVESDAFAAHADEAMRLANCEWCAEGCCGLTYPGDDAWLTWLGIEAL